MWDVVVAPLVFLTLMLGGGAIGGWLAERRAQTNTGKNPNEIKLGAWTTNRLAGSSAANALTRARIATHGILAMHRKETIYFFASQDDLGNPLDPDHDWEIRGRGFDCRWWSFTLYDEEDQLIESPSRRYSVHSDNVAPEADGSYRIVISRADPGVANWLAAGNARKLMVTIRLYNPSQAVLDDVRSVGLPSIRQRDKGPAA
jgi:hypothetical protein